MRPSMGPEVNIRSIRALDRQIKGGHGNIIELKRTRNSLLNISVKVPPEILAGIFVWCVVREENILAPPYAAHFAGLEKGAYTFLLVCHHWFEVASNTPELWSFWGNSLEEWNRRCCHVRSVPVDLVLDTHWSHPGEILNIHLRDTLRNLAAQDKIRQVHLTGFNLNLLTSVLSSLTPDEERTQERSIESIALSAEYLPALSGFFARSRLPKLRRLYIVGAHRAPIWSFLTLTSQTTHLTALTLELASSSPPPTGSQILSILASSPNLRELELSGAALPNEAGEFDSIRVPLRHAQSIIFRGGFRPVFWLLHRLEFSGTIDHLTLTVNNSTADDILRDLGPFMGDYFRRNTRLQGGLEVSLHEPDSIDISIDRVDDDSERNILRPPSARFSTSFINLPPPEAKRLYVELLAHIPRERVIALNTFYFEEIPEEILVAMPNIQTLSIYGFRFSNGFLQPNPDGPHANAKLLPSLRHLYLTDVGPELSPSSELEETYSKSQPGWGPLTHFLAQKAAENKLVSLHLGGDSSEIPWEIARVMRDLAEEFSYHVPGFGFRYVDGDREDYYREW